jgi:hypothetical protein
MKGFAAMVQPAAVDVRDGHVHAFRGRRVFGAVYSSYFRKKINLYLPEPAYVATLSGQ